jgi:hypothetical protein
LDYILIIDHLPIIEFLNMQVFKIIKMSFVFEFFLGNGKCGFGKSSKKGTANDIRRRKAAITKPFGGNDNKRKIIGNAQDC